MPARAWSHQAQMQPAVSKMSPQCMPRGSINTTRNNSTMRRRKYMPLPLRALCLIAFVSLTTHPAIVLAIDTPQTQTQTDPKNPEHLHGSVFRASDINNDGTLQGAEVRTMMQKLGGSNMDEENEIAAATRGALRTIDSNSQQGIQASELADHFRNVAARLSVKDVAEWVAHASMMPQYSQKFKDAGIAGHNLILLVENEGKALEDLGVTNALQRKVLHRNMMYVLLGVHAVPAAPKLFCHVNLSTCSATVFIDEEEDEDESETDGRGKVIPTNKHRLRIQRGRGRPWEEIEIDGEAVEIKLCTECSDYKVYKNSECCCDIQTVTIKAEAWNVIGRSPYTIRKVNQCDVVVVKAPPLPLPSPVMAMPLLFRDDQTAVGENEFSMFGDDMYGSRSLVAQDQLPGDIDDISQNTRSPKTCNVEGSTQQQINNSGMTDYRRATRGMEAMWGSGTGNNNKMAEAFSSIGQEPKPVLPTPSGIRSLFSVLDADGDGDIDVPELQAFISRDSKPDVDLAGSSKTQILTSESSTSDVNDAMNTMDDNNDSMIKVAEFDRRWRACVSLSWQTPSAVRDWVRFGVMLPEYGDSFARNSIDSDVLAVLVSPKETLERDRIFSELNVTDTTHQRELVQGVVDCVLAISGSSVPPPPTHLRLRTPKARLNVHNNCDQVLLEWDAPVHVGHHRDPHMYVIYRKCAQCETWEEVNYTDMTAFDDNYGLVRWGMYAYRVVAWNKVGPSRPVELHDVEVDNAHVYDRCEPWRAMMTSSWGWLLSILPVVGVVLRWPKLLPFLSLGDIVNTHQPQTPPAQHIQQTARRIEPVVISHHVSGDEYKRTRAALVQRGEPLHAVRKQAIARDQSPIQQVVGLQQQTLQPQQIVEPVVHELSPSPLRRFRTLGKRVTHVNRALKGFMPALNHRSRRNSDSGSSRGSSPAPTHEKPSRHNSGANLTGQLIPTFPPSLTPQTAIRPQSAERTASGRTDRCEAAGCNKVFTRFLSRKHICSACNRTVCEAHTAFHPHSPYIRCPVQSECLCWSCCDTPH